MIEHLIVLIKKTMRNELLLHVIELYFSASIDTAETKQRSCWRELEIICNS